MVKKFPHLSSPITIGKVTFRNRMFSAPMGERISRMTGASVQNQRHFMYTADAIRRHGAIPSLELSYSGMHAGTYMTDKNKQHGMNQWGPSDTIRPDGVQVKALTKEMLAEIVETYGNVAGLAKRAGFEMLMIHGGHGWLLNQFFSPYFNKRTDEYGGTWRTDAARQLRC